MSQSLGRALRLLTELGDGPRSLDELAAVLEVHKTTALRLLRTLEDDRLVYRDSGDTAITSAPDCSRSPAGRSNSGRCKRGRRHASRGAQPGDRAHRAPRGLRGRRSRLHRQVRLAASGTHVLPDRAARAAALHGRREDPARRAAAAGTARGGRDDRVRGDDAEHDQHPGCPAERASRGWPSTGTRWTTASTRPSSTASARRSGTPAAGSCPPPRSRCPTCSWTSSRCWRCCRTCSRRRRRSPPDCRLRSPLPPSEPGPPGSSPIRKQNELV